jgi:branched-chain amino acid transport system substrate-binding protein
MNKLNAVRARATFASLLLVLAIAVPAEAQKPLYTIDAIFSTTGPEALVGQGIYVPALRTFEKYINAHGGVNGVPLHFELHDDQTNPQVSVQLASEIIATHKAVMIGGGTTATCAAIAPLTTNGPVSYCLSPGYSPSAGSYNFAASASFQNVVTGLVRFARLKGFRRIAGINPTNASGQSADVTLQNTMSRPENRSLELVDVEHFNMSDVSISAQIEKTKASNPDVIVTYASGTGFTTLLRALRDAGISVPVLTAISNLDPASTKQYASLSAPTLYAASTAFAYYRQVGAPRGPSQNAVNAFIDAYKASGEPLTQASSFVWDPLWIMVSGLRKFGTSATASQLRDYILTLQNFGGVNGIYDFRSGDQHGLTDQSMAIVRWDPKTDNVVPVSKPGGVPIETQ